MANRDEVAAIIRRSDEVLRTAYAGLEMMKSPSGLTQNIGLRNVLTFGRSVTFVLQNLNGKHDRYEEWYQPKQERMKSSKLFSFFRDARNNLEKQGKLDISTSVHGMAFTSEKMSAFEAERPPGATSFFFGDSLGGSGWIVKLPNGEDLHYYVQVPESIAKVEQYFSGALAEKYFGASSDSTLELAKIYLGELSEIVDDASKFFLNEEPAQMHNGKRLPPHLRIAK